MTTNLEGRAGHFKLGKHARVQNVAFRLGIAWISLVGQNKVAQVIAGTSQLAAGD